MDTQQHAPGSTPHGTPSALWVSSGSTQVGGESIEKRSSLRQTCREKKKQTEATGGVRDNGPPPPRQMLPSSRRNIRVPPPSLGPRRGTTGFGLDQRGADGQVRLYHGQGGLLGAWEPPEPCPSIGDIMVFPLSTRWL